MSLRLTVSQHFPRYVFMLYLNMSKHFSVYNNGYSILSSIRTRIVSGFGGMQYTSVCNPFAQCKNDLV